MSLDPSSLQTRIRHSYERGRWSYAWQLTAWLTPVVILGVLLGQGRPMVCGFGAGALALATWAAWRGREGLRALIPGVLGGLIPFTAAHAVRWLPHACTHSSCTTWCVTACTMGGFVAGVAIVGWTNATLCTSRKPRVMAYAATIACLVGAMGCACVGSAGVMGLIAGLGISVVPGLLYPRQAR
jgi:hypothetical protein